MIGAIEAGGTKFVLATADDDLTIQQRKTIPTEDPESVVLEIVEFFKPTGIRSLAIGSFGPLGVDPDQADYGYIKKTPKPGWANFPMLPRLQKALDIPIVWTTDVNVAAYGELKKGRGVGKKNIVYFTIGTGVGAGVILNGKMYVGKNHPEMGHIMMRQAPGDDFKGNCPFHGQCLEGMAAGPALERRIGRSAKTLEPDDPVWKTEAYYIAQACVDVTVSLAPDVIIFGGGVSNQAQLFPLIRDSFEKQLNHYVDTPPLDQYIVHAELGDNAGIVGALLLAKETKG
jgi:fructokinase